MKESDGCAAVTKLEVPADVNYARLVRMIAANLAALAGFDIEAVDDVRMAAHEAFVYSLATKPGTSLTIYFELTSTGLSMDFSLGASYVSDSPDEPSLVYSSLILQVMCDECEIDAEDAHILHLFKTGRVGDGR